MMENLMAPGVLSPFLPGTKVMYAWDSTSLGMLKTCPRLYQYVLLEGYTSRDESIHLRFGIEYHQALQDYDLSRAAGINHEDAIHDVISALVGRVCDWTPDETTRAGKYKNRRSIVQLVVDYLDFFAKDAATTYMIEDEAGNQKPAVELSFRFELDWGPKQITTTKISGGNIDTITDISEGQPYLLSGHLDRVVRFNSDLFVMDRKTSLSTLGDYYFDQFDMSNQMTLYTLASQIVIKSPVKGVIIDAAQVLLEKPNAFKRGMTYRTPDTLDEWLADLRYWLALAEQFALQGYWPKNDTACDKFGGCAFRGVCSKSPQVRDVYLKSNFNKLEDDQKWNPLKPR